MYEHNAINEKHENLGEKKKFLERKYNAANEKVTKKIKD